MGRRYSGRQIDAYMMTQTAICENNKTECFGFGPEEAQLDG